MEDLNAVNQDYFCSGVNKEATSYASENGWFDSNLIRFRKGRPEKMGGWTRLSSDTIEGTTRSLHIWSALDGSNYMGVGTDSKFYVEEGGAYNDITPVRRTATLASNPFTTGDAGSGIVTVTDPGHGAVTNDFVTFSGATTTDGITAAQLNTEHQITIIDANSYTITTAGSASSGDTAGGGTPTAIYQINSGLTVSVGGIGFGAGLLVAQLLPIPRLRLMGLFQILPPLLSLQVQQILKPLPVHLVPTSLLPVTLFPLPPLVRSRTKEPFLLVVRKYDTERRPITC